MSGKTNQEAINELIAAYHKSFGEPPDSTAIMVIASVSSRVVHGESFEWIEDGDWRKLVWVAHE